MFLCLIVCLFVRLKQVLESLEVLCRDIIILFVPTFFQHESIKIRKPICRVPFLLRRFVCIYSCMAVSFSFSFAFPFYKELKRKERTMNLADMHDRLYVTLNTFMVGGSTGMESKLI